MTEDSVEEPTGTPTPALRQRRIHPAWIVALVALIALIGAEIGRAHV